MPKTHHRRRRGSTVESSRVGGVYWALAIAIASSLYKKATTFHHFIQIVTDFHIYTLAHQAVHLQYANIKDPITVQKYRYTTRSNINVQ